MVAEAPTPSRWLFGPLPDLLLGCGLFYALLFAFSVFDGAALRAEQPEILFPLLILLLSTPHYGATLLRVYEERSSRRAYVLFSVWATLLVSAAFVAGAYDATLSAWIFTVFLTWSPWHYTGQNYGLAVMFLRRRGVPLDGNVKRWLYASFLLSYVLVFLIMHGSLGGAIDRPLSAGTPTVSFRSLGLPVASIELGVPLAVSLYLICLVVSAAKLLRAAPARDLGPSAALVLTQALWFSIPFAAYHWQLATTVEPVAWRLRPYYFLWIVAGHSVQYLWITAYYARAAGTWGGPGAWIAYGAKVLIAGLALWTFPVVLFAPGRLGDLSYHTGLGALLAASINIHHFILDGAIWKLRHSRIAAVLIRPEPTAQDGDGPAGGGRGLRLLVWALASCGFVVGCWTFWEEAVTLPRAIGRGDRADAHASLDRLRWFGKDNFVIRRELRGRSGVDRTQPPAYAPGGAPRVEP